VASTDEVHRALTIEDLGAAAVTVVVEPRIGPPGSATALAAQGDGITAWRSDTRIGALWSNNAARNSFVYVNGVGWKKLGGMTDLAHLGLLQLARLARDTNARVDYRDEADGLIHEMYLW